MRTFGADIEYSIFKNEKFVPAFKVLKGTKKEPEEYKKYKIHYDNVFAEVALPISSSSKVFASKLDLAKHTLSKFLNSNYVIKNKEEIDIKDIEDIRTLEFGCDPDYNIYTHGPSFENHVYNNNYKRHAGFHIHIGFKEIENNEQNKILFAHYLDIFLGLPFKQWKIPTMRDFTYGKLGNIRLKEYGIEYRVLSPFYFRKHTPLKLSTKINDIIDSFLFKIKTGYDFPLYNIIMEDIESYSSPGDIDVEQFGRVYE